MLDKPRVIVLIFPSVFIPAEPLWRVLTGLSAFEDSAHHMGSGAEAGCEICPAGTQVSNMHSDRMYADKHAQLQNTTTLRSYTL